MLDIMFIVMFIFGIIMMLLSIELRQDMFWTITCAIFSGSIFMALGVAALTVDVPYQIYDGSSIVTGVHTVMDLENLGINWMFRGWGIIMILYGIIQIFGFVSDKKYYQ